MAADNTLQPFRRHVWQEPVWIVGHLVALGFVVLFVLLGFWQFERHLERAELDETLRDRMNNTVVPLDLETFDLDNDEYRRIRVSGTFLLNEEVVWVSRTLNGRSGNHALTPLAIDDESGVLVDRGWVPLDIEGPPIVGAEPPGGVVEVVGFVRSAQSSGGLGAVDPVEGDVNRLVRLIPERLQGQTSLQLAPFYIQLVEQFPPSGEFPLIGQLPEPGGGPPHLSYTVQWWVFAAVIVGGYPLLLRRTEQRRIAATSGLPSKPSSAPKAPQGRPDS